MPDILITEPIDRHAIEELRTTFEVIVEPELWQDPVALETRMRSVRAIIVRNQTPIGPEIIAASKELLVIGRAGAGLDNIDLKAASSAGIVVCSTPQENAISVAELVLAFMLSLARRLGEADQHVKAGGWDRHRFTGTEIHGKVLGIVGFGRIGFLTAMRAKAFGMQVLAYDEYLNPNSILLAEAGTYLVSLESLLPKADFVSCHVPLTSKTRGMVDAKWFSLMKPTAFLINASRGKIVNEQDLATAIKAQAIAGAALDVRETEPPSSHVLSGLDNVILTPHIAAFTDEAQERVTSAVCDDITRVLQGRSALNSVNFPVPRRGNR